VSSVADLYHRAAERITESLASAEPDDWSRPTPCPDWDLRQLTAHLVYEAAWVEPLLEGQTIEQVGDRFDGDLVGDDPAGAWALVAAQSAGAAGDVALDKVVHLSFGESPARDYLWQMVAEWLIHGWDIERALGRHEPLDPEIAHAVANWFDGWEDVYRSSGGIDDRVDVADDADDDARLLARFGRSTAWRP
jgi:uncharacterized protein (TIGR03086 family)